MWDGPWVVPLQDVGSPTPTEIAGLQAVAQPRLVPPPTSAQARRSTDLGSALRCQGIPRGRLLVAIGNACLRSRQATGVDVCAGEGVDGVAGGSRQWGAHADTHTHMCVHTACTNIPAHGSRRTATCTNTHTHT